LKENVQKNDVHSLDIIGKLMTRMDAVGSIFQKLERKEKEILSRAKKMSMETFPYYKKELVRMK
jgi:hypothetical protein